MNIENHLEHPSQEPTAEIEVLVIGKGFTPNPKMSAEIGRLLKVEGPDYCNDDIAARDALETLGVTPFVLPTVDGKQVCIINHEGEVAVTVPFKKDSHAVAAALYFVLTDDKSVLTCQM